MKTIVGLLFFLLSINGFAQTQETTYSFKWKQKPLKMVLADLEAVSAIKFAYSTSKVNVSQKINLEVNNVDLDSICKLLFSPLGLAWQRGGTIVTLYTQSTLYYTLSGYVSDLNSGERIIGAYTSVNAGKYSGISNSYGFFSLTLPQGNYEFSVQSVGFESAKKSILLNQDIEVNISLESSGYLDELVVSKPIYENQKSLNIISVPMKEINNIPVLLGEKDAVRYMMMQPGVQKGNEGSNYLFVRGGSRDQNLILLDDAVIYNAHHFLGLSSIFSGSELRRAELIKGGFSAKYGGRLSSVLNMSLKDGNKEEFAGEVNLGVISSRLLLESPIVKGKSSFLISGKRSYINMASKLVARNSDELINYGFHDIHFKVSTDLGTKDRLYVSSYIGSDNFKTTNTPNASVDDGIKWANRTASIRWNHQYSGKLFSNTAMVFSNYVNQFGISDRSNDGNQEFENTSLISSAIVDFSLKQDWDFQLKPDQLFKFGFGSTKHQFTPQSVLRIKDGFNNVNQVNKQVFHNWENYIYAEHEGKWLNRISYTGGLRISNLMATDVDFFRFEPRFNAILDLNRNLFLNTSFATMNQYLHHITNVGFGLPIDFWMPVTGTLKPQQSNIITLGITKNNLLVEGFSVAFETYYKQIDNAVAFKEGASFFNIIPFDLSASLPKNWNDIISQGNTESYGAEFIVKKEGKNLSGWISYTISKTTMKFAEINRGNPFPFSNDRTHDLGIFISYFSGKRLKLSASWMYGTGNAITLPVGTFTPAMFDKSQGSNFVLPIFDYENKNNFRMVPYHRLDFSLQYLHHFTKKYKASLEFSVFNMYNRANPFFYQLERENDNADSKMVVKQTSLFPIMPSISYTVHL